ncbi:MAG: M56 family metallopeptidase [Lachnospiraceae bacterium]|nr:M56 family metallopeptidase [Lachnospiraceae bacterium]
MKLSLPGFCLPGLMALYFLCKLYDFKFIPVNGPDIKGMYSLGQFPRIASQHLSARRQPEAELLAAIWLVGVVTALFLIPVFQSCRLHRFLKLCTPVTERRPHLLLKELTSQYQITQEIRLYHCSCLNSPFLTGIRKPKIILPDTELSEEELRIILQHELTHYQNRDILFRILIGVIQGINWFNPMMLLFSHMFFDTVELACDEAVSEQLSNTQKSIYARLLLRLAAQPRHVTYATSFSNDNEAFFKRRISIIMKKSTAKKKLFSVALTISIAALSCPLVSYASSKGSLYLCNAVLQSAFDRNAVEVESMPEEHVEYHETIQLPADIKRISQPIVRGANSVDLTLSAYEETETLSFTAGSGEKVRFVVSGDNSSDSFKAGLLTPSGTISYVNSTNGTVNHTFTISEDGTYTVYFENKKSSSVHILGTVYLNY